MMEEQIRRIIDDKVVCSVEIFVSGNDWCGALLDDNAQAIFATSGMTYFKAPTLAAVLDRLERWAEQARERKATGKEIWMT